MSVKVDRFSPPRYDQYKTPFILFLFPQYDQYKTPMENIGLQDSLLSRFDLLFIVLDNMDPESDLQISEHVLRMHRYRTPGEQEGTGEEGGPGARGGLATPCGWVVGPRSTSNPF